MAKFDWDTLRDEVLEKGIALKKVVSKAPESQPLGEMHSVPDGIYPVRKTLNRTTDTNIRK